MALSRKGFTIIEILLVIVLLTVAAAMTIPNFTRSFDKLELRDAANKLAYLMRYAQSRAIYNRRPLRLLFDRPMTRYWLEEADDVSEDEIDDETTPVSYRPVTGRFGRISKIP